jgi:nicotinamide mononucleotide transporter
MSTLEIVAVVIGVINILLIIRRSVWNFPFGIVMVALYSVIFTQAKLYSDAGLQVFFLAANAYGWWSWGRNKKDAGEVEVLRLSIREKPIWATGCVLAIAAWGSFMAHNTDASYPYWDASVAMLSITGQILMARRVIENWHYWIVVNVISIPLYIVKDLNLTAGLYVLFLILAIMGLREWMKALKPRPL